MKLDYEVEQKFDSFDFQNSRFLLAFSGGPDSVYLLWMLFLYYKNELNKHILLCYINYHDSPFVTKEEEIVFYYINKFQLPYQKYDVFYDKKQDKNFEEWARDYRYSLFKKIVEENHLKGVITAHQKTDVVETYLLQKQRNNLPLYYGLKEKNDLYGLSIYRPLLSVSKKELTERLDIESIPYYFDITNTNLKKKRNKIRSELKEEEINFYFLKIKEENNRLKEYQNVFSSNPFGMNFSLYESKEEEFRKRYCFFLLDSLPIKERREALGKEMADFLKKKAAGKLKLNDDIFLYRTSSYFFLHKDFQKINYQFEFNEKKEYDTPFFSIDLSHIEKFNLKKLPVIIRNRKDNDKISTDLPTKDVKKALQKQGVPFYLWDCYPVFEQEGKIICVPFYKDILNKKIPLVLKFF